MTLKELLNSCDFKDIAPIIAKQDSDASGYLFKFKEAFDILRNIEPEADTTNREEIRLVRYYDEFSQTYYPMITRWGDLDNWQHELTSEIIVEDELKLTDAEIAAHCLWELTYYGFDQSTPEKWKKTALSFLGRGEEIDMTNPYTAAAQKLENKLWDNYVPKKYGKIESNDIESRRKIESYSKLHPFRFQKIPKTSIRMRDEGIDIENFENLGEDVKYFWSIQARGCRNGAKRKRDQRQRKRIEKLERMAKVENDIRCFTRNTKSFTREELQYLFNTNLIYQERFHSYVYNPNQRIDYLIDLFPNYVSNDLSKYTHFLLMFRTASAYPLVQSELDILQNLFSQYLPASASIRYGYGNDENLNTEIGLSFLCSY